MKTAILLIYLSTSAIANDYTLVGKGLLEYSIFKVDIYDVSYFKSSDNREKIRLDYKTNIKRKYSLKGWKVGLAPILKKDSSLKEAAEWIYNNTKDFNKGDRFSIEKNMSQVIFKKNGKQYAKTNNPGVAKLVYEPWIGKSPIDINLKHQLLFNVRKK